MTLRRIPLVLQTSHPIPRVSGCGLTSHFGELKIPIRLLFYGIIILKFKDIYPFLFVGDPIPLLSQQTRAGFYYSTQKQIIHDYQL